jgi:ankyrin repeat protein
MLGGTPKVKEEERVRIACYLLQAGADAEARNDKGQTALDMCQRQNMVDAVKRFLAAKLVSRCLNLNLNSLF